MTPEAMSAIMLWSDTCSGSKPGWTSCTSREVMGREADTRHPKGQSSRQGRHPQKPRPKAWDVMEGSSATRCHLRGGGWALPRDRAILTERSDSDWTIFPYKSTFSYLRFLLLTSFQIYGKVTTLQKIVQRI